MLVQVQILRQSSIESLRDTDKKWMNWESRLPKNNEFPTNEHLAHIYSNLTNQPTRFLGIVRNWWNVELYIILKTVIIKEIINKNPRRQMTHLCGFFYTTYGMQQELVDISTFQFLTADILRTPTVI
jgi:hypothetical protein